MFTDVVYTGMHISPTKKPKIIEKKLILLQSFWSRWDLLTKAACYFNSIEPGVDGCLIINWIKQKNLARVLNCPSFLHFAFNSALCMQRFANFQMMAYATYNNVLRVELEVEIADCQTTNHLLTTFG